MDAAAGLPRPNKQSPQLAARESERVPRHVHLQVDDVVMGCYRIDRIVARDHWGTLFEAVTLQDPGATRVTVHVLEESAARDFSLRSRIGKLQGLTHAGIAAVQHADVEQGALVLTTPYTSGLTLAELLQRQGRLDAATAQQLLREVAEALHHAHQRGVAHGHLVPANILVCDSGRVRLQGFELRRGFAVELGRDRRAFARLAYLLLAGVAAPSEERAAGRLHAPGGVPRPQWLAIRDTLASAEGTRTGQVLAAFMGTPAGPAGQEGAQFHARLRGTVAVMVLAVVIVSVGGYLLLP